MNRLFLLSVLFITCLLSCKKEPESLAGNNKLELGQSTIDTITYWEAIVTTKVSYICNNEILNHGHCWGTDNNPSIFDNFTAFGILIDTNSFSSDLENLDDDIKYYVRAYFTSPYETIYGEAFSFTTVRDPCDGLKIIDIEGQDYLVAPIGDQCWMTQNLNVGIMINGDQPQEDDNIIQKYCYDNDELNCLEFGGMYQWDEVMNYLANESDQGICLEGWHIPSNNDLNRLEGFSDSQYKIGNQEWEKEGLRGSDVGYILKSDNGWLSDGNGIDKFGFKCTPGGRHTNNGSFFDLGNSAFLWTSTEKSELNAWGRMLNTSSDKSYRYYYSKENARYARCIKNN